jgi:acetyl-CoA carboxylase biotin carboxyl carrier protein
MNLSEIQTLIKFVSKSGVNEVELETKDFKINIKAGASKVEVAQMAMPMNYQPQAMPAAPVPAATAPAQAAPASAQVEAADDDKYVTIKSPMIGTFYRSANPEAPAFINVGDEIKPGDNICIIEAMKLFNEIESEVSGKIIKVLADDATPVEYDQPLFLIDPS